MPATGPSPQGGAQQARAWAVAVDVVYYMLGAGLMGYAIDWMAGTFPRWMLILGGVGLIVGMYRFVKDALALIRQDPGARPPLDPDDPN